MNVAELITLLQACPADLEVIVASYEQGYDPVTDLREMNIEPVADKEWYVGVYDVAESSGRKALLLNSRFLRSEEKP